MSFIDHDVLRAVADALDGSCGLAKSKSSLVFAIHNVSDHDESGEQGAPLAHAL